MKAKKEASIDPARDAREGNVELLYQLMDGDSSTNNDRDAYKWLWAAKDFASKKIDLLISDLEEVSSLRYDDSGIERALAHWELGVDYLQGQHGLSVDFESAENHLKIASRTIDLENLAQEVLPKLSDEAREVLQTSLKRNISDEVIELIKRLEVLKEKNAPSVVIANEENQLREVFAKFLR